MDADYAKTAINSCGLMTPASASTALRTSNYLKIISHYATVAVALRLLWCLCLLLILRLGGFEFEIKKREERLIYDFGNE